MPLDSNDPSNPTPEEDSPLPEGAVVVYHYDAEGRRIEPTELEADPAIILFKDDASSSIVRPADLGTAPK